MNFYDTKLDPSLSAVEFAVNAPVRYCTVFSRKLGAESRFAVSAQLDRYGLAARSRALLATSFVHLLGILIMPCTFGWPFLFTASVMVFSLLVVAEFQWDMRHSIDSAALTPEQQHFDREQHKLRQLST